MVSALRAPLANVPERITYKLGIMYSCRHGNTPQYLVDFCLPVSDISSTAASQIRRVSTPGHTRSTQPGHPSWVGATSTGQRAVMLCDWGVKADMVLFAGNTV